VSTEILYHGYPADTLKPTEPVGVLNMRGVGLVVIFQVLEIPYPEPPNWSKPLT